MRNSVRQWTSLPLSEIAEIERTAVSPENIKSGTLYVGLENITSSGTFVGVSEVASGDLASTKFAFTDKHILYGKLRPYLAKIVCPQFSGVCSTDILPILPGPKVDRGFLLHFLRQPRMVDFASSQTAGANLPRLSPKALAEFEIPLPPLSEQKRIADILDKADAIRRKRQEAIDQFGTLTESLFHEMFSHKLSSVRWTDLSDYLGELRYGTSSKSGDGGYTTLRIPNIVRGIIDLTDLKTVDISQIELEKLRLMEGDLLFVRTNGNPEYVGRCAVFDPTQMEAAGLDASEIIYASYLIRARLHLDRLRPLFLQSLLQTPAGRRDVREKCRTSAGQYNINTVGLGALQVPVVAVEEQLEFETRVRSFRPVLTSLTSAHSEADTLFSSLVQGAFKGEL